jgi:outer membrane protein assembly factor BamB
LFGLYAYDMNGTLLWSKDLGDKRMRQEFGEGQTPVLHGNRIVVQWDHQGQSFITALDKLTGNELWRVDRQEIDSWGTPLVVEQGGRAQVVATAMNKVWYGQTRDGSRR